MLDIVITCVLIVISLFGLYKLKNWITKQTKDLKNRNYISRNIIPIIHNNKSSLINDVVSEEKQQIDLTTFLDFMKAYNRMNKDLDINIVINTPGGSLSAVESIVNCILNHKGSGRIRCYIPFYAYSGGCAIALACHEIIMTKNSIVGPCDGQLPTKMTRYSVASIINAVEYKKSHQETVKEEWLATAESAKLCQLRQRQFIDRLIQARIMNETTAENVYTELFTGKYNHDISFSAQDLINLGLNVTLIDSIPTEIMNAFDE